MRKVLFLASASLVVLTACSEAREGTPSQTSASVEAASADYAEAAEVRLDAHSAPLAPVAQIAYAFSYVLSVPSDNGAELMSRHELACVTAGPGLCQVVQSRADWTGRNAGGRLELLGQPDWINRFRAGLALEARAAGGQADSAVTAGDDVTARLDTAQTQTTTIAGLAERIEALQARRGGTAAQQLAIEQDLAALRRQQDEQALALRQLSDRVATARLSLEYQEGGVFAADNPARPVALALRDAAGLSLSVVAALITAGSVLLPLAGLGGLIWWGLRRRRPAPTA